MLCVCEPFTAAGESRKGQSSKGMELPPPKCLREAGESGDGAHQGGFAWSVIPVIHTPLKLAWLNLEWAETSKPGSGGGL